MYNLAFQCRGGRAVFQFYPENARQIEMITAQSMRAGFTGGLVVDFPNSTKAKKYFLVLMTGGGNQGKRRDIRVVFCSAVGVGYCDHLGACLEYSRNRV